MTRKKPARTRRGDIFESEAYKQICRLQQKVLDNLLEIAHKTFTRKPTKERKGDE